MERVAWLDAYLDTRDARITYQEETLNASHKQGHVITPTESGANVPNEEVPVSISQKHTLVPAEDSHTEDAHEQDTLLESPTRLEREHDPMSHLVLDNMEISMVHVLPVEFQLTATQQNFLDGNMVAEEATQVDFVATDESVMATRENKVQVIFAELFICSPSVNLRHLKPLYVTAHIEGYLVSKFFVDCGATVNIMPFSIMKALRRSNDELIPSGVTMSSFVSDKLQTKGVLPLEVTIIGHNHMIVFFIVDSKTEYNALLGQDWIH